MDDIAPKKLSAMLAEKHKRIIDDHQRELDSLRRIIVLKEKLDQLEHWIDENENPEKYLEEREASAGELEKLKNQFQCGEPSKRYAKFEKELDTHIEAMDYWREYERRKS